MSSPKFDLSSKVALITGAGRGIGLAIARAIAAAGASVAIQDIDLEAARGAVAVLTEQGHNAIALGGDIADRALPRVLIDRTTNAFGGLHILINNAAVQFKKHWLELTLEDFDKVIHPDVAFPMMLSQAAAAIFKRQKWGRIINIGSMQQVGGNPMMLPYSMSKAALVNQTVALARDLGRDNITVNLIAPGYFDTLRNENHFKSKDDKDRATRHFPIPRLGQPEDCAVALLLASEAGSYITGQSIQVDGGMTL